MVFYDGFTYIHKLLDFRRVGGELASTWTIYRGTLYTCHLALGQGTFSALSMLYIVWAFRLGVSFISLDGFHRGVGVITIIYKKFSKKYKK